MKFISAVCIASVMALGSMGAAAHPGKVITAEEQQPAAKRSPVKVRYTYRQCIEEWRLQCKVLYPGDRDAELACWQEKIDTLCATLPGAP